MCLIKKPKSKGKIKIIKLNIRHTTSLMTKITRKKEILNL